MRISTTSAGIMENTFPHEYLACIFLARVPAFFADKREGLEPPEAQADFEGIYFGWQWRQLPYCVYCSVLMMCYMCFARSLFEEMWAKQCVVWEGEPGLAAEKFSSAELVTTWPRGTSRRKILGVLRSLLAKMRVMNLGGVCIGIMDLDIYIPHMSQLSLSEAFGPEMTIHRRTQICHSK